jgi:hypothetical protein
LTAGNTSVQYSLQGKAGDVVTITLTSSAFDSYLTLLDPGGKTLVTDDDGAGGKSAQITSFKLPADGAYIILAESYNKVSVGAYTLTVAGTAAQNSGVTVITATPIGQPAAAGGTIDPGQAVNAAFDSQTRSATYTFQGQAGQQVTITLTSEDFDVILTLKDTAGATLVSDDDSAGNLNARIKDFILPYSGGYQILVASSAGASAGKYALKLESGGAFVPSPVPTEAAQQPTAVAQAGAGGPINLGDTVNGSLAQLGATATYTFVGRAGDVVTIVATSSQFDINLELRGTTGRVLVSDNDSAGNLNAQIANFPLPVDGTYTVIVGSDQGKGKGNFTITLSGDGIPLAPTRAPRITPTATPIPVQQVTPAATIEPTAIPLTNVQLPATIRVIDFGRQVQGVLSTDRSSLGYSFNGKPGDVVAIQLTATGFTGTVALVERASGKTLISKTTAQGPLVGPYTLTTEGEHVIVVGSATTGSLGRFTVRLDRPRVNPIGYGYTVTLPFTVRDPALYFTFQGEVGDVAAIRITAFADTTLTVVGPDGTVVAFDDDGGQGNMPEINRLPITKAGTYTIIIQQFDPLQPTTATGAVVPPGGGVTVTMTRTLLRQLFLNGTQSVRLNSKLAPESLTLTGLRAGTTYVVTIAAPAGLRASPVVTVAQGGTVLATKTDNEVATTTLEFRALTNDPAVLQLDVADKASVTLRVTLRIKLR